MAGPLSETLSAIQPDASLFQTRCATFLPAPFVARYTALGRACPTELSCLEAQPRCSPAYLPALRMPMKLHLSSARFRPGRLG